jgi:hypothetical protein
VRQGYDRGRVGSRKVVEYKEKSREEMMRMMEQDRR